MFIFLQYPYNKVRVIIDMPQTVNERNLSKPHDVYLIVYYLFRI